MKIWPAVTLCLLIHIGRIESGEKEDDEHHPVHEHHEDTHHTEEMKKGQKWLKEKFAPCHPSRMQTWRT